MKYHIPNMPTDTLKYPATDDYPGFTVDIRGMTGLDQAEITRMAIRARVSAGDPPDAHMHHYYREQLARQITRFIVHTESGDEELTEPEERMAFLDSMPGLHQSGTDINVKIGALSLPEPPKVKPSEPPLSPQNLTAENAQGGTSADTSDGQPSTGKTDGESSR